MSGPQEGLILDQQLLEILREAVRTRQRKEELERSIGRAVRRHDLDFRVYVQIVDELREMVHERGTTLELAASACLEEGKGEPKQ